MEVRIEKLVYGGDGLGHFEGQTVFVPLVLPGELVKINATSKKKKFVRGRLDSVVEASPERIVPRCPHFGKCGGCQYQHIPDDAQLRYKSDILRETLGRIGRVQWDGPIETRSSSPYGYRNRAQWKIRTVIDGDLKYTGIGYFEAASTRLCAVTECPILTPKLAETLAILRTLVVSNNSLAQLDEIEAFTDDTDQRVLLNVSAERLTKNPEIVAGILREALPSVESILIQDRKADKMELFGPGYMSYTAAGVAYRVGHLSFFQVNRSMVDTLVETVIGDSRGRLAIDLFAGVGLFTVPLTKRFDRVIGVEANLAASKDLEANLQSSGGTSPTHRHATAESFLTLWHETPDLVVLDPPRAGVEPETLEKVKKLHPWRINYLSCDPSTLARDLASLVGNKDNPGPYEIRDVYLFDIFPQTYHMEALVRLKRRT